MRTTEIVFERALVLASEHRDEEGAVAELLEASMGKRVSLVMARQRIKDQADELGTEVAEQAASLLDAAIGTGETLD